MKYQPAEDRASLLLLSDNNLEQKSLYEMLCRSGLSVDIANSLEKALIFISENPHRVILTNTDKAGIELLKTVREKKYPSQVIMLSSFMNIESAVDTIKTGAFDYLVRPIEDEKILSIIAKASANIPGPINSPIPEETISTKEGSFHGLVGSSPQMRDMYSIIERISNSKATVLLRGESGTGKRLVAHAIHMADKKRKGKPFVELSCGALPREIIESELFGHTKGSFTGAIADRKGRFELANGGTILLDDIDTFSLDLQVKLLRVLQHKEFERVGDHKTIKIDVRIIATTNQNLKKALAEGKFRQDLYYRLNVISINIPPLRERKEDLPSLIEHCVNLFSKENHKEIKEVTDQARQALIDYNWPGNIRELENIIERAVILDLDSIIDKDDLPEIIINSAKSSESKDDSKKSFSSLKDALRDPEKVYILKVLQDVAWNKNKAALKLGVNRTTLYNKLRQHRIVK